MEKFHFENYPHFLFCSERNLVESKLYHLNICYDQYPMGTVKQKFPLMLEDIDKKLEFYQILDEYWKIYFQGHLSKSMSEYKFIVEVQK